MLQFTFKRILVMIPMLLMLSLVSFTVITLPPGDYLSVRAAELRSTGAGEGFVQSELNRLEARYGLGRPLYVQYLLWMKGIVTRGDFGESFQQQQPVTELIWERLALTIVISFSSTLFIWAIALPVGIYSAVNQYSLGDNVATFLGFIGRAIPSFLLALILLYVMFKFLGQSVGGLFSPEYAKAPWDGAKIWDLMKHLWVPVVILGTGGAAGLIRTMRANLLDELHKPYVAAARARGLSETRLLLKYPVRVALNPFMSELAWLLPYLVGGSAIVSVVLNLPTSGPMYLAALQTQDMYLAGSFMLMIGFTTLLSTLLSDLLLAWLDPRIRHGLG